MGGGDREKSTAERKARPAGKTALDNVWSHRRCRRSDTDPLAPAYARPAVCVSTHTRALESPLAGRCIARRRGDVHVASSDNGRGHPRYDHPLVALVLSRSRVSRSRSHLGLANAVAFPDRNCRRLARVPRLAVGPPRARANWVRYQSCSASEPCPLAPCDSPLGAGYRQRWTSAATTR